MHPTTAEYLVKAHHQDLESEAAKARLSREVRQYEPDGLRPRRWGLQLPHAIRFLRRPAAGAATA